MAMGRSEWSSCGLSKESRNLAVILFPYICIKIYLHPQLDARMIGPGIREKAESLSERQVPKPSM